MAKARGRLIGMEALRTKLGAATSVIVEGAVQGVREGAEALESGAKADAPRDTGRMADGIGIEYSAGGLVAEVAERDKGRTHIAEWVEHGTSSITADPFMAPNAARERRQLPRRIEKAVAARLDRL